MARTEAGRDVETALLRLRDVERATSEVAAQERQLTPLRERERVARRAVADSEALHRALRWARARHLLDRAEAAMGVFPIGMERVGGDEPAEIAELDTQNAELADLLDARSTDFARADGDRQRTGLVDKEIGPSLIRALRGHVDTIAALDRDVTALQREVQGAIAERDAHRRRLAVDLSEQQLNRLDTDGIRELAALSHDYADLRTRRQVRDEIESWLGAHEPPTEERIAELERGVGLVVDRLRTPSDTELGEITGRHRLVGLLTGLGLVTLGIVLAITQTPLWALLALVGVLLIIWHWRLARPVTAAEAARLEREYAALNLPQPSPWVSGEMRTTLGELERLMTVALVDRERDDRWQRMDAHRAELSHREAELTGRRDGLVARYGVAPDLGEESLRLLAENLSRWQAADGTVRAGQANLNAVGQERRAVEARLRDQLERFDYTSSRFGEDIDALDERLERFTEADDRARALRREIDIEITPQLQRLGGARAAVFRRLDLQDGDSGALDIRIAALADWRAAFTEIREREAELADADEALGLHPELKAVAPADLQRRLETAEGTAADLDPALTEIAAIETRVGDAKHRHDQENALRRRDAAVDALRGERDEAERRVAGDVLLDFVRERTRDAALPVVFHRARELFTIVTRGRYELQFEEGPPPAFTARDSASGHTLGLDQLSSGTRVQLLMAIRLAFVENVERGPRLPLLLDETLGNSDELRAGAIVDAAIEISRNGRQVFYFTAQGDEVARWQARLDQIPEHERPSVTIVDLAEVRQAAGIERLPVPREEPGPERAPVPEPRGMDRAAYGDALRVPGIDPWAGSLGGVHLWHAVTEPWALHRLLAQDLRTWGQLRGIASTAGGATMARLGIDDATWHRADGRMRLLDAALEAWRIGRARPLTIGDVAEWGEVPSAAMPAVADALRDATGRADVLLDLLRERDIPGVDAGTIERLETWLTDGGFIATATPLDRDAIRRRMMADAADRIAQGTVQPDDVTDLLTHLPTP